MILTSPSWILSSNTRSSPAIEIEEGLRALVRRRACAVPGGAKALQGAIAMTMIRDETMRAQTIEELFSSEDLRREVCGSR